MLPSRSWPVLAAVSKSICQQLLDVADNLERAIASAKEAGEGGGDSSHDVLLQGVEMTAEEVVVQQWWLRLERGVVRATSTRF